jgi:hypothetical protein
MWLPKYASTGISTIKLSDLWAEFNIKKQTKVEGKWL